MGDKNDEGKSWSGHLEKLMGGVEGDGQLHKFQGWEFWFWKGVWCKEIHLADKCKSLYAMADSKGAFIVECAA